MKRINQISLDKIASSTPDILEILDTRKRIIKEEIREDRESTVIRMPERTNVNIDQGNETANLKFDKI